MSNWRAHQLHIGNFSCRSTLRSGSVAIFNNYLWSIKRAAHRFFCYVEDNYRLLSACIFWGEREMNSSAWMDWKLGSLYGMDDLKQTHYENTSVTVKSRNYIWFFIINDEEFPVVDVTEMTYSMHNLSRSRLRLYMEAYDDIVYVRDKNFLSERYLRRVILQGYRS